MEKSSLKEKGSLLRGRKNQTSKHFALFAGVT